MSYKFWNTVGFWVETHAILYYRTIINAIEYLFIQFGRFWSKRIAAPLKQAWFAWKRKNLFHYKGVYFHNKDDRMETLRFCGFEYVYRQSQGWRISRWRKRTIEDVESYGWVPLIWWTKEHRWPSPAGDQLFFNMDQKWFEKKMSEHNER